MVTIIVLKGVHTVVLQGRNPIRVKANWRLVQQEEKAIACRAQSCCCITDRYRSKNHTQTSLLWCILHQG